MAGSPAFRLFGFPVHVRPGFLMMMALLVFINGTEYGPWLAGSAAVLTLLHELGHAWAASATGARAEIALDFLAGYASFVPPRKLKRWESAGISLAGPAVQIVVGVLVLALVFHVDPFAVPHGQRPAVIAIWWTGPVMGLANLLPVLPLDGGNIVVAALDVVLPGRARQVMLWFSVLLTGGLGVALLTSERTRWLAFFVIFLLLAQLQMLFAQPSFGRSGRRMRPSPGSDAEAQAWATGAAVHIADEVVPSPWFRAWQQIQHGYPDDARALLVADFADPNRPNWWPPVTASAEQLRPIVALLPRPLPHGRLYSDLAMAMVLQRIGEHEDAVRYAAETFERSRSTPMAVIAARSAAALDETDTALAWLTAAADAGTDPDGLLQAMNTVPEFAGLRADARFTDLRERLAD